MVQEEDILNIITTDRDHVNLTNQECSGSLLLPLAPPPLSTLRLYHEDSETLHVKIKKRLCTIFIPFSYETILYSIQYTNILQLYPPCIIMTKIFLCNKAETFIVFLCNPPAHCMFIITSSIIFLSWRTMVSC